ncbi:hypothetical protein L873DRAFT_1440254 [Choiromyces venosus 120613-1]|uniref:Uncharacterized protein n=1 Tax=Choiromyces venosus 120613-1 TaxID=1336337 RepID=A0A3N4J7W7_9PEZI|nr:hypothetical protein L873DRAFT_1440254 [Choiromyces venosus 120613-1]
MAAVNNQQPEFDAVAEAMNGISLGHAVLATHFERMQNLPAVAGGAQILAEVRALGTNLGTLRTEIGTLRTDMADMRALLHTEVGTLRTEMGALHTGVGALCTEVGTLCTEVGTLRTDMEALHIEVGIHFEDLHIQFEDRGQQVEALGLQFEDFRPELDEIRQAQQAAEFNSLARLENNTVNMIPAAPLSPLRTAQNQPINGFPETLGQLNGLHWARLNALLTAYGLPTEGTVPVRRTRFKMFISVIVDHT